MNAKIKSDVEAMFRGVLIALGSIALIGIGYLIGRN